MKKIIPLIQKCLFAKPLFLLQAGLLMALLFSSSMVSAKTVVFIHGYLAGSNDWRGREVVSPLLFAGWMDGGNYHPAPEGFITPPDVKLKTSKHAFYTVDLPSGNPIELQTNVLSSYLQHLYQIRKEPIILVAHSAGGVVARAYLIRKQRVPVKGLVTIATPHLGTPLADLGVLAANTTPIGDFLSLMGMTDVLQYEQVLHDLRDEESKGYLYWLNHRPHPSIFYVSVVRHNRNVNRTDMIVPSHSQNMNNVWALRGQSVVVETDGDHFLSGKDGEVLIKLLPWLE